MVGMVVLKSVSQNHAKTAGIMCRDWMSMSDSEIWRVRTRLKKLEQQVKYLESELAIKKIEKENAILDQIYDFLKTQEKK